MIRIILNVHLFFTETHLFLTTTWELNGYITDHVTDQKFEAQKKIKNFLMVTCLVASLKIDPDILIPGPKDK